MASRIEDYALIGDCETAALVGLDGSIDWLCLPSFDSGACFAALLGDAGNGRWKLAPAGPARASRRYRTDTMVLETQFTTSEGVVMVTDFMPPRNAAPNLVRLVTGVHGRVAMRTEFIVRFDYGAAVPWVTRQDDGSLRAVAGPDQVVLHTPVELRGEGLSTVGEFEVAEGETVAFVLSYGPSHLAPPAPAEPSAALADTIAFWTGWVARSEAQGPYAAAMRRSLLTLKALTYAPTGGLVAAPTTSLPESLGGERNWDYRFCWIRDSTLTLLALMGAGYYDEAKAWTDWLQRAVAGSPGDMQIMYGLRGERRLMEWEAGWLAGYGGARPVRIGNDAHRQLQLDIYGELMDTFYHARRGGLAKPGTWSLQLVVMDHVAKVWREPDEGIWEVRGGRRHFIFSKVMAWVAADRAIKCVETFGLEGPVAEWQALREAIRVDVMAHGLNPRTGGFQRAYDDPNADASLLLLAELGFVAADDPRFVATVAAVERELIGAGGLVMRYDSRTARDGLPPGEGAFMPCSFWLANAYTLLGRRDDATTLFERLLGLTNDVGLLAEEYDAAGQRMVGNFPQAFSHLALLSTAMNLTAAAKPSEQRPSPG